jgi:hypothetical protein
MIMQFENSPDRPLRFKITQDGLLSFRSMPGDRGGLSPELRGASLYQSGYAMADIVGGTTPTAMPTPNCLTDFNCGLNEAPASDLSQVGLSILEIRSRLWRLALLNAHLPKGQHCWEALEKGADPAARYITVLELLRPDSEEFGGLLANLQQDFSERPASKIGELVAHFIASTPQYGEFEQKAACGFLRRSGSLLAVQPALMSLESDTQHPEGPISPELGLMLRALCLHEIDATLHLKTIQGFESFAAAAAYMMSFDNGQPPASELQALLAQISPTLLRQAEARPAEWGKTRNLLLRTSIINAGMEPAIRTLIAKLEGVVQP